MLPEFLHCADIHLGYVQYNIQQRSRDFAKVFGDIADYATKTSPPFVLIAGDLFHKRNINAFTYLQAFKVLSRFKNAHIPVIAIEGNHDVAYFKDRWSWLEALASQDMLTLLRPLGDKLVEYVIIDGTMICGTKYMGSRTESLLPKIEEQISTLQERESPENTILMMHCGVDQQGYRASDSVSLSSLVSLKEVVDYLALGHYHDHF